jgi:protein-tyrosine phosphatase
MSSAMGAVLTYDHSLGMNYTRILDDLIVGSCLQTPQDVEKLEAEGVTTVLQLQEDSDLAYFSLDNEPIRERCAAGKQIEHIRHAVRDFDPYSLRRRLPEAVALIAQRTAALGSANGTTYIHCTAGLGRAPATALAYMWWFKGMPLNDAYAHLTALRPCKPREDAIREAAVDLLYGKGPIDVTISLRRRDAGASDVRIAGLDVGWGQSVPMVPAQRGQPMLFVKRQLPPGKYQFKFIWDGVWGVCMDHMTTFDGENVNNMLLVPDAELGAEAAAARHRIRNGGDLTDDERAKIRSMLVNMDANPYSTSAPANLQPF